MEQRNAICLYSQETTNNLRLTIDYAKSNGYDRMVLALVAPQIMLNAGKSKCFSRSGTILESTEWSSRIIAKINDEFDCDSKNKNVRKQSEEYLYRELEQADHVIPYAFALIKVTGLETINLARTIVSRFMKSQLLVEIPMVNPEHLIGALCSETVTFRPEDVPEDPWRWWNTFRTNADFSPKLSLALEISAEIPSKSEIFRWQGEPIGCLIIPAHLFVPDKGNHPVLSTAHQNLILSFKKIANNLALLVKCNIEDPNLKNYSSFLRNLIQLNPNTDAMQNYADILQEPLQPLYDNLDSVTYEVFETDPVKYLYYQKAIEMALIDMVAQNEIATKTVIVMVVGAGRGPLLRSSLNAAAKTGRKIKLYAVEKNPHAINSLRSLIDELWKDKDIELIARDMRDFHPPEKADILVSELLGSFGDNELSPECLDGAQKLLKPTGISIPSKYASYTNPVMSTKIYNSIRKCNDHVNSRDRVSSAHSRLQQLYVIYLKSSFHIASPQRLFEFVHPNWNEHIDNSRFATVSFDTKIDCVLTGFAGYFDAVLYKDVILSTNPLTHTKGLWSWFPVYFPLTEPIQVKKGDKIVANFWRSMARKKIWYEWSVSKPIITHIHNLGGTHCAINL